MSFFFTFVFKSVNFRFVCCRSFGLVFIIQSCFALILFWIYQCWFELFPLVTCGVKSVWERFRTSRKGIILQWKPQEFDSQSLSNHSLNKHRHQYPLILKLKTYRIVGFIWSLVIISISLSTSPLISALHFPYVWQLWNLYQNLKWSSVGLTFSCLHFNDWLTGLLYVKVYD